MHVNFDFGFGNFFLDRQRAINAAIEDAKITFGYADMENKEFRCKLPPEKKKEILKFLFERGEYHLQKLQGL